MYSPTTLNLRVTRKSNLAFEERKSEKGDEALGAPSAGGSSIAGAIQEQRAGSGADGLRRGCQTVSVSSIPHCC